MRFVDAEFVIAVREGKTRTRYVAPARTPPLGGE
jgi:hypothetical protein